MMTNIISLSVSSTFLKCDQSEPATSTGTVTRVGSFSRGLMQMRSGTPQILSYRRYLIKRNHIFEVFYSLDK